MHLRQMTFVLALIVAGLVGGPLLAQSAAPSAQDGWSPPRTVYIPETGHTIDGVFLDVWRAWNGAASFGYPITEELEEDGRTVQYYQFARFEYRPDDPDGNVVQFGEIGAELLALQLDDLQADTAPAEASPAPESESESSTPPLVRAEEALTRDEVDVATPNRRYVAQTGHTVQFGFKTFWESTGEEGYLGYPLTEEYVADGTTYQFFERGQLRWEPQAKVRMVPIGEDLAARYGLATAPVAQGGLPTYDEALFEPPPTPAPTRQPASEPTGAKWIEVNLSTQYMIAWQGDTVVYESYVSTGKAGFETPPGTYQILVKKPVEDMEGVIGGEYYNVSDVPDVMYFTNVGHAFHGAYWHSNFGAPMSHGCINLPLGVAEWLYEWTPIGTTVEIHY